MEIRTAESRTRESRSGKGADRLLNGWKEIASFFSKDERTVRRWASGMDLPVHRVPGGKRGAVYAYSDDLDRWLTKHRAGSAEVATPAEAESDLPGPIPDNAASMETTPGIGGGNGIRRSWAPFLAGAGLLAMLAIALWVVAQPAARTAAGTDVSRPQPYQADARAEQLFLDAQYNLATRRSDGLRRAAALFTEATIVDPDYAEAFAGMADAYNLLSQYTVMPAEDAYPKALAAAQRALRLDANSSRAYAAMAFNTFYWKRDFKSSLALFKKALEIDPDNAAANAWYALVVMQDRQFDTALKAITKAEKLLPQAPEIKANKALILFHSGRSEEAVAILLPLAETQPNMLSPHAYLATIFLAGGALPGLPARIPAGGGDRGKWRASRGRGCRRQRAQGKWRARYAGDHVCGATVPVRARQGAGLQAGPHRDHARPTRKSARLSRAIRAPGGSGSFRPDAGTRAQASLGRAALPANGATVEAVIVAAKF